MTNQDEVAIQRAVERALVNIWLPFKLKAEHKNDAVKEFTEVINTRTTFEPLQYNDPAKMDQEIKIKGEIKGNDIQLRFDGPGLNASPDIPPPPLPPPSREVITGRMPSMPDSSHPSNQDWMRSDVLAVCGVLLQLVLAILLLILLIRL